MKILPLFFSLLSLQFALLSCNSGENNTEADAEEEEIEKVSVSGFNTAVLEPVSISNGFESILCQAWDYEDDIPEMPSQEAVAMTVPYRGFIFYADGKFVQNPRGSFSVGTWNIKEENKHKTLRTKLNSGSSQSYYIVKLNATNLVLQEAGTTESERKIFVASGLTFKNAANDPFALQNNLWRIAPVKPETDLQIQNRVKGFVHFFNLYYQYCIDADLKTINFSGLPSCYKWYSGGIYLKKPAELPANWIDCFYSKIQAQKGVDYAEQLLSKKYTWPKNETNWVKLNGAVLRQMDSVAQRN